MNIIIRTYKSSAPYHLIVRNLESSYFFIKISFDEVMEGLSSEGVYCGVVGYPSKAQLVKKFYSL